MSLFWKPYLSDNEKVMAEFGISSIYAGVVFSLITVAAVYLTLRANPAVGAGVFVLGLLYWLYLTRSKRYAFTSKKIILLEDFLGKNIVNVEYDKITDITIDQSFIDTIGGWGSIIINTSGNNTPEIVLMNVNNPYRLKSELDKLLDTSHKT